MGQYTYCYGCENDTNDLDTGCAICQKREAEEKAVSALVFKAVTDAQKALADWIVPESGISDADVLNTLLGILDDGNLVRAMKEAVSE